MNCMPESADCTSRDRAHQMIIGKHKRPCSPFGMIETASSSSYISGGEGNNTGHGDDGGCMISYYTNSQSSEEEEEEDMANCLIMLAQSDSPVKEDKSDLSYQKTEKLINLRLAEIADSPTAGVKSDFHNYECKTCNRAFASFQALGGHRASHKKPKLSVEDRNSVSTKTEFSEEDQPEVLLLEYEENNIITINNKPPSPPLQTGCNRKIHECSICGSKFLSGQALGGHMRRHRPAPPSSNQIAVSTNTDGRSHYRNITEKSPVLSLDLNLPAPEFVDDVHLNFQFTASPSQQSIVFSAPALVDCHY